MKTHLRIPAFDGKSLERNACGSMPYSPLRALDPCPFAQRWIDAPGAVCAACVDEMARMFFPVNLPPLADKP